MDGNCLVDFPAEINDIYDLNNKPISSCSIFFLSILFLNNLYFVESAFPCKKSSRGPGFAPCECDKCSTCGIIKQTNNFIIIHFIYNKRM